jgi:hypothetical protein
MVWTDLAQDRDQWRALVNTVMDLRVPSNFGKFLRSCRTEIKKGSAPSNKLFTKQYTSNFI